MVRNIEAAALMAGVYGTFLYKTVCGGWIVFSVETAFSVSALSFFNEQRRAG
jgi:hypothetical protein